MSDEAGLEAREFLLGALPAYVTKLPDTVRTAEAICAINAALRLRDEACALAIEEAAKVAWRWLNAMDTDEDRMHRTLWAAIRTLKTPAGAGRA